MITTKSKFYYGHTIDEDNNFLDFKEGAGSELTATLDIGEYTLTDFVTELARALNAAADTLTFTVSINRSTRIITISADGAFTILGATGTHTGNTCLTLAGFANSDTGSATSHAGTSASGSEWKPQWTIQNYVSFDDNVSSVDGFVRESTSGVIEAISYGRRYIMEANFRFITDVPQSPMSSANSSLELENDSSGVANARSFLTYAITKAPMEFMPDRSDVSTFEDCILESTPESPDGLAFKLKELYSLNLSGYYETGVLTFRRV